MNNLIRADISAMWKSKAFWGCLISGTAAACIFGFASISLGGGGGADKIIQLFQIPMFAAAVFCAMFIGVEHSEKTIRNKMIVGKTRARIYFANLTAVFVGSLVIAGAYALCIMTISIPYGFSAASEDLALRAVICICALAALCSITTLIAVNISKRSVSAVLAIAFAMGADIAADKIQSKLKIPLTVRSDFYNEEGEYEGTFEISNVFAPSKTERAVLQTVFNILPFGDLKCAADNDTNVFLPLYSFGVISVTTAAGMLIFRKKDIK